MSNDYKIELVDFSAVKENNVRVMVCQLDFDEMVYEKGTRLCFVADSQKNRDYIRRFLNVATKLQVDLLVFPELVIPAGFVDEMVNVSSQYDMYIVAGTHYKLTERGYLSICPIVTPNGVYYTEKITPAPVETSSFNGGVDGAISGNTVYLFKNSKIGDFAVTICLDYTNDSLRVDLDKDRLDFLIVAAFNQRSEDFYYSMQSDIQRSSDGMYLIYCNALSKKLSAEGRSALFAFMDKCFKNEFKDRGCTDLNPSNKVYEFSDDKSYCVFDLNVEHKKPYNSKNGFTESNVMVLEEDNAQLDERYKFLKTIGVTDDKYKFIDQYYVKPREYNEMHQLLENENVLVITGDPGIGKTYTAIHFLCEYYKKGFRPTWFHGMAKEDRDEQKKSLLDFEPRENDIVYIEDPFGRTVFENREELKTLFSNLVERFKAYNAKLIITSRLEVFKQFEQEVLNGDRLESYRKELNVKNPSYRSKDLIKIAKSYIEAYTSWSDNNNLVGIVIDEIKKGHLISPLMIYNLVQQYSRPVEEQFLRRAIQLAKSTDLVSQFADEIKMLSYPGKILLYLVLLYGKKNIKFVREMFSKVQKNFFEKQQFEGSSFAFELKAQENHRIQRLGAHIPVYGFSHPTYEEALIVLAEKDPACVSVLETCLELMVKEDSKMAVDIFKRFIFIYPKFLENLMSDVIIKDFNSFTETSKLDLIRKMLLSDYKVFQDNARELYPISGVINSLYDDDNNNTLFELRLRMLNRRKDEIGDNVIDWCKIFTAKRISQLHPTSFLYCYNLAYVINNQLIADIKVNIKRTDVIRKFILLPTTELRNRFDCILRGTEFQSIYQDLKNKIPDDIMDTRINKRKYVGILRKYILNKDKPKGVVLLDNGAMRAVNRGATIYPVGVLDVEGNFENGDIVQLACNERTVLTMVEMSSDDIRKYKGLHSQEIYEIANDVVHTVISRSYYREYKPYFKKR